MLHHLIFWVTVFFSGNQYVCTKTQKYTILSFSDSLGVTDLDGGGSDLFQVLGTYGTGFITHPLGSMRTPNYNSCRFRRPTSADLKHNAPLLLWFCPQAIFIIDRSLNDNKERKGVFWGVFCFHFRKRPSAHPGMTHDVPSGHRLYCLLECACAWSMHIWAVKRMRGCLCEHVQIAIPHLRWNLIWHIPVIVHYEGTSHLDRAGPILRNHHWLFFIDFWL